MAEKSLAEQAYETIEQRIISLRLPPGKVFTEQQLSTALGFGRTPIREALQRLSSEYLVTTIPRKGMVVSPINVGDQLTLLETRRVLDRLLAMKAARRANSDQRSFIIETAVEMEQGAAEADIDRFMIADREMDRLIELASMNPFAVRASRPLHVHCRRFWYYYQRSGDLKRAGQLHRFLADAIAAGDEQAAGRASDAIIDYLEEFTRLAIEQF
jgi:DNA-binding GntR family transcriptional regulator